MFSHESTDNLLDNLESELTELVELDDPKPKTPVKNIRQVTPLKNEEVILENILKSPPSVSSPFKVEKNQSQTPKLPPPVPAKRNFFESSPEKQNFPVPAMRKIPSLDKKGKNDENEIIQMTTLNSDHGSSDIEHISRASSIHSKQSTIISVGDDNMMTKKTNKIKIIHESEKMSVDDAEESFYVIKHGKWASVEDEVHQVQDDEISEKAFKPTLEVISEKKPKVKKKKVKEEEVKRKSISSETLETTDSSSIEESPKPKKKVKKQNNKKEKKKKAVSDERTSAATEASSSKKSTKKIEMPSTDKAIGKNNFLLIENI